MTQTNTTQNKEELERKLIGKNVHSVYTLCNKCHSWGINIPLHEVCGNCNSDDTILYYDIETVNKSISQAHQSGIEEGKKSNRDFVIKLKADMAHAIGFCRGLGHPETYLEKNYPELCSKENK